MQEPVNFKDNLNMKRSDNIEDIYPLSPLQQGMLFHTVYDTESEIYFEQLSCALRGALNIDALRRAWQSVLDRHTILRTAFFWERRDKPLQVVRRKALLPWEQLDWRGLSGNEQQERFDAFLEIDRGRGFELSKAPLMRVALIQLAEETYYLVWSHHHILLDGWSVSLVMNEVFALYEAFSRGQEITLKRSHPYREYVTWLLRQDMSKAESFWRRVLNGFTAPTPLPVDSARASLWDEKVGYGEQETHVSHEATAALKAIASAHRLTLNTFAQGAWAMLLGCYGGGQDVLFGTVISGRPEALEGVETMVGLFLNTLPVRVRISPESSVLSWLKQLQEQNLELRQYEYSPLMDIQGWSEVARGKPLFDSLLVFENYPIGDSLQQGNGSLVVDIIDLFERANYPLTLFATPEDRLSLEIVYDYRRFDASAIKRMLEQLRTLLEAIAANPDRRLSDFSVLTQAERQQVIDRLALPSPEQAGREWDSGFVAPRSPVEEVLAEIWAEVLRVDKVGAHDNFFELGGHSLLATRVVSRVYETFQIRLPMRKMFEAPTLADLATVLLESGERRKIERIAELLLKVTQLSDKEAEQLLEEKLYRFKEGAK